MKLIPNNGNLTDSILMKIFKLLREDKIYLSPKEYCKWWGISRTRFDEMISRGEITERNGTLADGCSKKRGRKHVYRFFDPFRLKVHIPPLA